MSPSTPRLWLPVIKSLIGAVAAASAVLLAGGSVARAERRPVEHRRASERRPPPRDDKAGPFMINLKLGAAINAKDASNAFALEIDGGYAVTPDRNGYIVFSPSLHAGTRALFPGIAANVNSVTVLLPVGFQYDIPLPPKGLYLYPRLTIGYAVERAYSDAFGQTTHFGVIEPAVGIKYVYNRLWNFGVEPFSLPIYFNRDGSAVQYRILVFAGVNLGG